MAACSRRGAPADGLDAGHGKPDAEEGRRGVRIIAAIERALATGRVQELALPPVTVPPLIKAAPPEG